MYEENFVFFFISVELAEGAKEVVISTHIGWLVRVVPGHGEGRCKEGRGCTTVHFLLSAVQAGIILINERTRRSSSLVNEGRCI